MKIRRGSLEGSRGWYLIKTASKKLVVFWRAIYPYIVHLAPTSHYYL
jgi:hypothetical protein